MMRITGDADIVIEIKSKALGKTLRCIFATFIDESLRTLAQLSVENGLITFEPLAGELLSLILCHRLDIGREHAEKLVEVCQ